jgi:putative isomerase
MLLALLTFLPLPLLAHASGIRSVYSSALNPAAFSLQGAVVETALNLSWAPLPFPSAFGALFTATLAPPLPGKPTYFRVTYGATSASSHPGAFLKLWCDDHFLVNSQTNAANTSVNGYYPLTLAPGGSRLRVEYAAIGDQAFVQLFTGPTDAGPWALVPSSLLTPILTPAEDTYQEARSVEEAGWNTWDSEDMLSSVLLPSGLAFPLSFSDAKTGKVTSRVGFSCTGPRAGLHSARGAYTEVEALDLEGGAATVKVESATTASGDLIVLVTTLSALRAQDVVVVATAANALPFSACTVASSPSALGMKCAGGPTVTLRPLAGSTAAAAAASGGDFISLPLPPVGGSVAFSTAAQPPTLAQAQAVVAARREELLALFASYSPVGGVNETFAGLYTSMAWTAVYSHTQGIVNGEFGRSEKLYEWDTLFASVLGIHVDRWMAYNNIIRIAKGAVPDGFFPGFIDDEFGEVDNAKPQVAALALARVFGAFKEAWVVELVIDAMAKYNAWWPKARMVQGLVAPGSLLNPQLSSIERAGHNSLQAAKWETGLDNSPLYDTATYNATSGLMSQWDVGMHALLIADAQALVALAQAIGRSDLVPDLSSRAAAALARLEAELWCEEAGVYLNKDYVTGAWVKTTGPPNLYPLLAGAPTLARVEGMLQRYLLNASEWCGGPPCLYGPPSISRADPAFREQNYWRGRVWGPMNYLLWVGLQQYSSSGSPIVAQAAAALATQSKNTFLVEWLKNRRVMENYGALDGTGCETASNANPFYHWGALTAAVFLEHLNLTHYAPL